MPQITISLFDAFRAATLLIYALLAGYWLRRKTLLKHYLPGRWVGGLVDRSDPNFIIDCVLYISLDVDDCSGYLYYKARDGGELVAQGVDRLSEYEDRDLWPTCWNPLFEREFHKHLKQNRISSEPALYTFKCSIERRWTKDMMRVQVVDRANRTLCGVWRRR